MSRIFIVFLIVIAWNFCPAKQSDPLDQAVYLMTTNEYSSGFSKDSAQFGDLILIEIMPGKKIVKKGAEIPFFKGGMHAGTVKLTKQVTFHCDSKVWIAKPLNSAKFEKDSFAIVSASAEVKGHATNERSLTKDEEKQILELAVKEFKKQSFVVKNANIKIESNKVISDPDHPEVKTWAGSFIIKESKQQLRLFLIADMKDNQFSPALSSIKVSKDLEDGKDDESETYIEHFNMRNNHFDKIITEIRGYESTSFKIYSKETSGWNVEFIGGESGC